MKISSLRALLVLTIACTFSSSVLAQFVWLDENGHKQYSDQAPPASIPKSRILKFNGKSIDDPSFNTVTPSPTSAPDEKVKKPDNLADQELAYKKRQAEQAEKAKKDEAQSKDAALKSQNCQKLKDYKQGLESGLRVSQMNADGTTGYITDEKRAQELKDTNQSLSGCGN